MDNIDKITVLGALLFGIATIITILVALGFPLGEFTMGGKYKVIPPNMRIMAWGSVVIQILAILIIMQTGNLIPIWFPLKVTRGLCFFFAVYLSINSIMNFLSDSKLEKFFITPLSVLTAICFWIVAFYSLNNS